MIIQLPKGWKEKSDLKNRRHIHTKGEFEKHFMHIVTTAMKPIMFKELSPFQIGAVPGPLLARPIDCKFRELLPQTSWKQGSC